MIKLFKEKMIKCKGKRKKMSKRKQLKGNSFNEFIDEEGLEYEKLDSKVQQETLPLDDAPSKSMHINKDDHVENNENKECIKYTKLIKSFISYESRYFDIAKEKDDMRLTIEMFENLLKNKLEESAYKTIMKTIAKDLNQLKESYKETQLYGMIELLDSIELILNNTCEGSLKLENVSDRLTGHRDLLRQKIKLFDIKEINPQINEPFDPHKMEFDIKETYDFEKFDYIVVEILNPGFEFEDKVLRKAYVRIREAKSEYEK